MAYSFFNDDDPSLCFEFSNGVTDQMFSCLCCQGDRAASPADKADKQQAVTHTITPLLGGQQQHAHSKQDEACDASTQVKSTNTNAHHPIPPAHPHPQADSHAQQQYDDTLSQPYTFSSGEEASSSSSEDPASSSSDEIELENGSSGANVLYAATGGQYVKQIQHLAQLLNIEELTCKGLGCLVQVRVCAHACTSVLMHDGLSQHAALCVYVCVCARTSMPLA